MQSSGFFFFLLTYYPKSNLVEAAQTLWSSVEDMTCWVKTKQSHLFWGFFFCFFLGIWLQGWAVNNLLTRVAQATYVFSTTGVRLHRLSFRPLLTRRRSIPLSWTCEKCLSVNSLLSELKLLKSGTWLVIFYMCDAEWCLVSANLYWLEKIKQCI